MAAPCNTVKAKATAHVGLAALSVNLLGFGDVLKHMRMQNHNAGAIVTVENSFLDLPS